MKNNLAALQKKLNIKLPYDPAFPLLGIKLKHLKAEYSKHTLTPIFIAALFTIVKRLSNPNVHLQMNR